VKIAIFDVESWERDVFEQLVREHDVTFLEDPLTRDNAGRFADRDCVAFFPQATINAEVLDQLPALKLICTRSTGVDHIDLVHCKDRGITVCNVPTYGTCTVAEHVFALLLAISHKVPEALDRTRRGDFSQSGLRGFDLIGKTFGVIGTGDIGLCTIHIARGFRMDVLAFDVRPRPEKAAKLGFTYVNLDDLLSRADIISLHVPSNPQTRNMLSHDQFARMKDGVVLINTARGDVIDIQAMLRALISGKVAAAGLDVLPEEPSIREEAELLRSAFYKRHNVETLLADHILFRLRNVLVTPHSGFNTREAVYRLLETTVENISAYVDGLPRNVVV
jgi:D-lactate dehydrogenase